MIYLRKREELTGDNRPKFPFFRENSHFGWHLGNPSNEKWQDTYPGSSNGNFLSVGFCGEIYPAFFAHIDPSDEERLKEYREKFNFDKHGYLYCYSIDRVDTYMQGILKKKEFDFYMSGSDDRRIKAKVGNITQRKAYLEWFSEKDRIGKQYISEFEKKKCPIFVDCPNYFEWNANLGDVQFQRVFDPQQAFQRIEMFMSNLAWPEKHIPKIGNDDNIERHGFDLKYSFRKAKGK